MTCLHVYPTVELIFLSYFSIICPCFVEELCDKDLNPPPTNQPTNPRRLVWPNPGRSPDRRLVPVLGGKVPGSRKCDRINGDRDQWVISSIHGGIFGGIYTLLGTNISPEKSILKMIFLFPRWVLLISWTVSHLLTIDPNFLGDPSKSGFVESEGLKNGFSFITINR